MVFFTNIAGRMAYLRGNVPDVYAVLPEDTPDELRHHPSAECVHAGDRSSIQVNTFNASHNIYNYIDEFMMHKRLHLLEQQAQKLVCNSPYSSYFMLNSAVYLTLQCYISDVPTFLSNQLCPSRIYTPCTQIQGKHFNIA